MVQFTSLTAWSAGAAIAILSTPAWACDTDSGTQRSVAPLHRRVQTANALDRVDRILDSACKCATAIAGPCRCAHPERRVFEKLSGSHDSLQLPKEARYDASAGVFL